MGHLASARAMAQQMIHSDFMHSVLSSGVANGTEKVDLIDGILLYVAFDDATQDSLDRLATACERLLVIVVVIAVLLGVFLIGFVVKKVHSNHSGGGPPKMTEETTMTMERSGNDVRH